MTNELLKLGFRKMVDIRCIDKLSRDVYLSAECGLQDSGIVVNIFFDNPAKRKISVVVRSMYLRKDCVTVPLEHAGIAVTSLSTKDALEKAFGLLKEDLERAEYYVDITKSIHQMWTRKMLDAIKGLDD